MIRLEQSEVLKRKTRRDDPVDLGISTWALVLDAVRAGKSDKALDFIDYETNVFKRTHDALIVSVEYFMTKLASFGEENIESALRDKFYPRIKHWLATTPGVEESLQVWVEHHRGHQGNISVVEEPDRYVVTLDPCGSGGRLRRTVNVGTTQKAYPWSWSQAGVPYYCTHCCISWEIIATELRGYPIKVALPGARPEDPCIHLFYKKPELIPEEYFTRIGKRKTLK